MLKREFSLFCIIGFLGYLVDVFVVFGLKELLGVYGARIPSFFCAATVTWVLNRRYTFIAVSKKPILAEYLHYLSLMGIGGCINYLAYAIVVSFLGDWRFGIFVAVASGSLAGLSVNFLTSKRYVFNGSPKK